MLAALLGLVGLTGGWSTESQDSSPLGIIWVSAFGPPASSCALASRDDSGRRLRIPASALEFPTMHHFERREDQRQGGGAAASSAGPRLRAPPWEPGDRVRRGSLCLIPLLTSKETQAEGGARLSACILSRQENRREVAPKQVCKGGDEAMRVCRGESGSLPFPHCPTQADSESKHLLRIFIYLLHDKTQKVTTS